jgi:hypothetical protein
MIFLSQVYLSVKKINNEIDMYIFSKTNKWTYKHLIKDKTFRFESALELKKCNDFILEDVDVSSTETNYVSNKSRLFGNVHYNYLNSKFLNEHFKRDTLKKKLYNSFNNKEDLEIDVIKKLESYNVVLLSTAATAKLINYDKKIYLKNNDPLTIFNNQIYFELKSCLKLF